MDDELEILKHRMNWLYDYETRNTWLIPPYCDNTQAARTECYWDLKHRFYVLTNGLDWDPLLAIAIETR